MYSNFVDTSTAGCHMPVCRLYVVKPMMRVDGSVDSRKTWRTSGSFYMRSVYRTSFQRSVFFATFSQCHREPPKLQSWGVADSKPSPVRIGL